LISPVNACAGGVEVAILAVDGKQDDRGGSKHFSRLTFKRLVADLRSTAFNGRLSDPHSTHHPLHCNTRCKERYWPSNLAFLQAIVKARIKTRLDVANVGQCQGRLSAIGKPRKRRNQCSRSSSCGSCRSPNY